MNESLNTLVIQTVEQIRARAKTLFDDSITEDELTGFRQALDFLVGKACADAFSLGQHDVYNRF